MKDTPSDGFEVDGIFFRVRYRCGQRWRLFAMFASLVDAAKYVAAQTGEWRITSCLVPGSEPATMGYDPNGDQADWNREPCMGDAEIVVYPEAK